MVFRAFGIQTTVQFGFLFTSILLGVMGGYTKAPHLLLAWVAIVFVSIMVHELGHAFAMIRFGLRPEITLHMMGGLTSGHGMQKLTRPRRIFISFAGPLAGFVLGGMVYAMLRLVPDVAQLSQPNTTAGITIAFVIDNLLWVNIGWGIFNLMPVLPLDGGHILEDLMGPKRAKLTAIVSLVLGIGGAIFFATRQMYWIAVILGLSAVQTYQRFRMAAAPVTKIMPAKVFKPEEPVPASIDVQLRKAKQALDDENYDEAGTLAELVIAERPPKRARVEALTVLAWAHLLQDRTDEAGRVLKAIGRDGEPDPALSGAVLFRGGHHAEARTVLEAARAAGDNRKEIAGPLIQILIAQGAVEQAAGIALDIVDTLSEDDARQMAVIAFDHGAFGPAARLSEKVFERAGNADDAYAAARSRSLEGDLGAALGLLRRAVAAGFDDRKRAWSDTALAQLRDSDASGELETLLPRP